jgi:hypothetical protein
MKSFLGIGHTCIVTEYEKSIGITSGYSRALYARFRHTVACTRASRSRAVRQL